MRKVQRLAERRRVKRPEMRGSDVKIATVEERFFGKVCVAECGCHNWTGYKLPNGYGQFRFKGKAAYAHRVAWELANGSDPGDAYVLHSCDNRMCVNPEHLSLGSFQDNMDDMTAKRRHAHGSRNAHAKLTVEQIRAIRASSKKQAEIAAEYGVTQGTISVVRSGRTWQYV